MNQHKTTYECRNNEWAESNEPYNYASHKVHCAVRDREVVKIFKSKKAALQFVAHENKTMNQQPLYERYRPRLWLNKSIKEQKEQNEILDSIAAPYTAAELCELFDEVGELKE